MPADILLYAIVAAGLVVWLRSVLGTRHGDERQRPNPFTQTPPGDAGKTAPLLPALNNGAGLPSDAPAAGPLTLPKNSNIMLSHAGLEPLLQNIARLDRNFALAHFGMAAQDAFVMIVEAFARGDRDLLRSLLAPDLYQSFDRALTERSGAGHVMTAEIHAIRKVEISDAQIKDKMVYITIRFIADETIVTRDRDGHVVSGHAERLRETIDIWTFGRNAAAKDPTWFLYATREEDGADLPAAGQIPV